MARPSVLMKPNATTQPTAVGSSSRPSVLINPNSNQETAVNSNPSRPSVLITKTKPKTGAAYYATSTPEYSIGPSSELDSSGKPFLDYRNKGDKATTTDRTRVDTPFDPTKASPHTADTFYNPRAVVARATLKKQMGGTYNDELDHIISLELSGSNQKENLQIEPMTSGGKNTATDPLENRLAKEVSSGQKSLFDAQVELAKAKGKTLPWTPSKKKSWLSDLSSTLKDVWNNTASAIENTTGRPSVLNPENASYKIDPKTGHKIYENVKAPSTSDFLPSSIVESLPFGIGSAIKGARENGTTDVTGADWLEGVKTIPGNIANAGIGMVATPVLNVAGAIGSAITNDKTKSQIAFNIPGIGEISNRQYQAAQRIRNGEDPTAVALDEGGQSILDTLFLSSILAGFAAPREVVTKEISGKYTPPQNAIGADISSGPKSFRLYSPKTLAQSSPRPLTVAELAEMEDQGIDFGKKFDPQSPTFFRVKTSSAGGNNVVGQIVQIKPSYFDMISNKIIGKTGQLNYFKDAVASSEAFNVDKAIASGDIPKEAVYKADGKTLTPEFAQGRVNDVAQKLDQFKPGLGNEFKQAVDVNNTTMPAIVKMGEETLSSTEIPKLSPTSPLGQKIVAVNLPKLPPGAVSVIQSKNADVSTLGKQLKTLKTQNQTSGLSTTSEQTPNQETQANNVSSTTMTPREKIDFAKARLSAGAMSNSIASSVNKEKQAIQTAKENAPKIREAKIKVETDPSRIQEIENSIREGQLILRTGASNGRKYSKEELGAVQRSVDNALAKLGKGPLINNEKSINANVPALETILQDTYKKSGPSSLEGFTKADETIDSILNELQLSKAGSRLMTGYGADFEVKGIPSTFPDWIPEQYRTQKKIQEVTKYINQGADKITYPTGNKPAQRAFVDAILDILDKKLGINTKETRNNILKQYEKETKQQIEEPLSQSIKGGSDEEFNKELEKEWSNKEKPATKEDKLMAEAKKYDSADAFVKSQPIAYHGTLENFDKFDLSMAGKNTEFDNAKFGIFFTRDKQVAQDFIETARQAGDTRKGIVKEVYIYADKPIDFTTNGIFNKELQAPVVLEILSGQKGVSPKEALKSLDENIDLGDMGDLRDGLYGNIENKKILQNHGYDGIIDDMGDGETREYVVFDPSQIKTKQDLIDIWNKAHPKVTPELRAIAAGEKKITAEGKTVKVPDVSKIKPTLKEPGMNYTLESSLIPGLMKTLEDDIIPTTKAFVGGVKKVYKELANVFNPTGQTTSDALDTIFEKKGEYEETLFRTERAMKSIRNMWDKQSVEARIKFLNDAESGNLIDPEYHNLFIMYRERLDNLYTAINFYKDIPFLENYFPQFWEKNPTAEQMKNMKASLQGPRGFLKKRIFQTVKQGIEAGLTLKTSNPEELVQQLEANVAKFIMAQKIKEEMIEKKLWKFVRKGDEVPEDFARIDDAVARIYYPVETGTKIGNVFFLAGEYFVQKDVARLINNFLSRDLIMDTAIGKGLIAIKNTMNAFQLGLSAFHLGFEMVESVTTKFANGIVDLTSGNITSGLKNLVTAPLAPYSFFRDGQRFYNGDQHLMHIEKALFTGGASLRSRQYYKNTVYDTFIKRIREGNYLGAAFRLPLAAIEASTRPLLAYYIPRLKVGAFRSIYASEVQKNIKRLETGDITYSTIARNAWTNVENRMGELNYDNLFYSKVTKTALMLTFRAVSWNIGTIREIGGSITDTTKAIGNVTTKSGRKKFEFTQKMAHTFSLFFLVGLIGAIYQYLHTGKKPESVKDLYYPRNGALDSNGQDYRVELPTYLKDTYQFSNSPIKTVANKFAPEFTSSYNLLQNEDFFGDNIRNKNDNATLQMKQISLYLASQFEPISVQQVLNLRKGEAGIEQQVEAMLGITKAPQELIDTEYTKMIKQLYNEQRGGFAPRTPEQKELANLKVQAINEIKNGDYTTLNKLVDEGLISKITAKNMEKNINKTSIEKMFKGLSKKNKAQLYASTTPEEQQQ